MDERKGDILVNKYWIIASSKGRVCDKCGQEIEPGIPYTRFSFTDRIGVSREYRIHDICFGLRKNEDLH